MKKIFNYIAAAAALTLTVSACSDALAPAEGSTEPQVAGTVEITVSNITDNSFDVTIAPRGTAAYYAYLVDNDEYYEGIDASKLYSVSYESVAQGNVKYSAGSESYAFTVEAEPNTTYTIYAVAGSPEGNVGEVAYKTILTTDGVDPDSEDFDFDENTFYMLFSEGVLPVEGKSVLADVYTGGSLEKVAENVEGKIIANKNGVIAVEFEDITIPGSIYLVHYAEGTFTDGVGNPCPALEAGEFEFDEDGALVGITGFYGYLENVNFEFDTEDIPEMITDWTAPFTVGSELELLEAVPGKVTVSFFSKRAGKTVTSEYKLDETMAGILGEKTFGFILPDEPLRGDLVTLTIPEGTVYDIYGNTNEELVIEDLLYSYNYTLDDIVGEYTFTCDEEEDTFTMGIAAYVPNEEDKNYEEDVEMGYNVQFTSFRNFACQLPVKGVFDFDLGTLFVPDYQVFTVISGYYACIGGAEAPYDLTFYVTAPGYITTPQVIELEAINPQSGRYAGYFAHFSNFVATRVEAEPEEPGEGGASLSSLTFTPSIRK